MQICLSEGIHCLPFLVRRGCRGVRPSADQRDDRETAYVAAIDLPLQEWFSDTFSAFK